MRQYTLAIAAGLLGVAGLAGYAHSHLPGHAHATSPRLHALSGTPTELAERSQQLAEHVCAEVGAGVDCALFALARDTAEQLHGWQPGYLEGQRRLHQALLNEPFVRAEVDRLAAEQAATLQQGSLRYSQFLGDCVGALSPQQKQTLLDKLQQAKH